MEYNEFSLADHELRIYVIFLDSLNDLAEQINELQAELNSLDYPSVSSPKIKSTEEAKYKDPPKVYMEDAPLQIVARKDSLTKRIHDLQKKLTDRMVFCNTMQNKIACLGKEDLEILGMRYFDHMSLRAIGECMGFSKNTIQRKINSILARF